MLEQAAVLGNTDAMCLLGNANESGLMGSDKADKWYQMAADHDAACGYAHFLDSNEITDFVNGKKDETIQEKYLNRLLDKASHNDRALMRVLSLYYREHHQNSEAQYWGEKASELGDATMMSYISGMIKDGDWGWYILSGSREKAAKEWMLKAAEYGNPTAMDKMAIDTFNVHDDESMLMWFERGRDIGYVNSIMNLALLYLGQKILDDSIFVNEKYINPPLGYACYYSILSQLDPSHSYYTLAKEYLQDAIDTKKLTVDDIQKGNEIAEKWMKTHQARDWSVEFGLF